MSAPATSVRVVPGPGLVGRAGDGILVVPDAVAEEQLIPLLTLLRESCEGQDRPGRLLARRVAQHVLQVDPAAVPVFAVVAPTDEGWAVTLHGDVELSVVRGGVTEEQASGLQAATWVDRIVPEGFDRLVVGPDAAALAAPAGPFDLEAGVVPGGGVVVAADDAAPPTGARAASPGMEQPAEQPAPGAPDDATAEQSAVRLPPPAQAERQQTPPPPPPSSTTAGFESVSLLQLDDVPEREPLPVLGETATEAEVAPSDAPLVKGVLCANGHFNHPQARYCSVDGVSMVHRTLTPVQRPRPTLGVLVSDDGSAYPLDHDYLVGREPDGDDGVISGELTPLSLADAERSVSRVHAEIRLEGWDVTIIDRGSVNGTYVAGRTETEWRRLPAGRQETIAAGTRIAFGKRIMTFDSHHQT